MRNYSMRSFLLRLAVSVLPLLFALPIVAQVGTETLDTDQDGLSDGLEQRLLLQFMPEFHIGAHDCAGVPASFAPELQVPTPVQEDGTIYGQVFPARDSNPQHPVLEAHFYHLWDRDCGSHGHNLDTEHVAVLLQGSGADLKTATWQAQYWYAAAHESTVCDVSQIARASTLGAETRGAKVWISPGKHASFLDERLCARGCGADRCEVMKPLQVHGVVNLGEPRHPMNGSIFIASTQWPLEAKMTQSNFAPASVARLETLPQDEIAWYSAGRHPAQGVIAKSAVTESALAGSEGNTAAAISVAGGRTGNALSRSFHNTTHSLGVSARRVEGALGAHASSTESGEPLSGSAPKT